MRQARQSSARTGCGGADFSRGRVVPEQIRERRYPQAGAGLAEEVPAREKKVAIRRHAHSLVTVTSRFKITLATVIYAASSLASALDSAGVSPTLTYFRAAARSAWKVSR